MNFDPRQLVDATALEDLPALAGKFLEGGLLVELRLRSTASNGNGQGIAEAEPKTWITPEQAAVIAAVPKERIYSWAKGQRWASRPSRRCLRIEETGFRRWLLAAKGH